MWLTVCEGQGREREREERGREGERGVVGRERIDGGEMGVWERGRGRKKGREGERDVYVCLLVCVSLGISQWARTRAMCVCVCARARVCAGTAHYFFLFRCLYF